MLFLFLIFFLSLFALDITITSKFKYKYYISNLQINKTFVKQTIYFFNNNTSELKSTLNTKEFSHMLDVKEIIQKSKRISIISFITSIILIFLTIRENHIKNLKKYALITITVYIVLIIILLLFFRLNFALFHKIFFPQGNYSFPRESILIKNYTTVFFKNYILYSFIETTIIFLIILNIIDRIIKSIKTKNKL